MVDTPRNYSQEISTITTSLEWEWLTPEQLTAYKAQLNTLKTNILAETELSEEEKKELQSEIDTCLNRIDAELTNLEYEVTIDQQVEGQETEIQKYTAEQLKQKITPENLDMVRSHFNKAFWEQLSTNMEGKSAEEIEQHLTTTTKEIAGMELSLAERFVHIFSTNNAYAKVVEVMWENTNSQATRTQQVQKYKCTSVADFFALTTGDDADPDIVDALSDEDTYLIELMQWESTLGNVLQQELLWPSIEFTNSFTLQELWSLVESPGENTEEWNNDETTDQEKHWLQKRWDQHWAVKYGIPWAVLWWLVTMPRRRRERREGTRPWFLGRIWRGVKTTAMTAWGLFLWGKWWEMWKNKTFLESIADRLNLGPEEEAEAQHEWEDADVTETMESYTDAKESFEAIELESTQNNLNALGKQSNAFWWDIHSFEGDPALQTKLPKHLHLGEGKEWYPGTIPHILDNTFDNIHEMNSHTGVFKMLAYADLTVLKKNIVDMIMTPPSQATWAVAGSVTEATNLLDRSFIMPILQNLGFDGAQEWNLMGREWITEKVHTFLTEWIAGENTEEEVREVFRKMMKVTSYTNFAENAYVASQVETMLTQSKTLCGRNSPEDEWEEVSYTPQEIPDLVQNIIRDPSMYQIDGQDVYEDILMGDFRNKKLRDIGALWISLEALQKYNPQTFDIKNELDEERAETHETLETDGIKSTIDDLVENADDVLEGSVRNSITQTVPVANLVELLGVNSEEEARKDILAWGGYDEIVQSNQARFLSYREMLTTGKDAEGNPITQAEVKAQLQQDIDEYYIYLKEIAVNAAAIHEIQDEHGNTGLAVLTTFGDFAGESASLVQTGVHLAGEAWENVCNGEIGAAGWNGVKAGAALAVGSGPFLMLLWAAGMATGNFKTGARTIKVWVDATMLPIRLLTKPVDYISFKVFKRKTLATMSHNLLPASLLKNIEYDSAGELREGLKKWLSLNKSFEIYKKIYSWENPPKSFVSSVLCADDATKDVMQRLLFDDVDPCPQANKLWNRMRKQLIEVSLVGKNHIKANSDFFRTLRELDVVKKDLPIARYRKLLTQTKATKYWDLSTALGREGVVDYLKGLDDATFDKAAKAISKKPASIQSLSDVKIMGGSFDHLSTGQKELATKVQAEANSVQNKMRNIDDVTDVEYQNYQKYYNSLEEFNVKTLEWLDAKQSKAIQSVFDHVSLPDGKKNFFTTISDSVEFKNFKKAIQAEDAAELTSFLKKHTIINTADDAAASVKIFDAFKKISITDEVFGALRKVTRVLKVAA